MFTYGFLTALIWMYSKRTDVKGANTHHGDKLVDYVSRIRECI